MCNIANNEELITPQVAIKLQSLNYMDDNFNLTSLALRKIAKYKVQTVVLFAAGKGSRLMPITKTTPKPLIKVKNKPIIEGLIENIISTLDVKTINIVVWHLRDQFLYLVDKYKSYVKIKLVENYEANVKNNISSFEKVKTELSQAYVIDGDIIINKKILKNYHINSCFFAKYSKNPSKEWMLKVDEKQNLVKVEVGGSNSCYMSGVCYIDNKDAQILCKLVNLTYLNPKHQTFYWEHLVLEYNHKLHFKVTTIKDEDIIELDNLDELIAYDNSWENIEYDDVALVKKIAHETFFVTTDEIKNIEVLEGGLTNKNYKFEVNSKKFVIRIPQKGTNEMLDRANEAQIYTSLKNLDFCEQVVKYFPKSGIKITKWFAAPSLTLTEVNSNLKDIAASLYKLHTSEIACNTNFDPLSELNKYINLVVKNNLKFYNNFEIVKNKIFKRYRELKPSFVFNFCHNDLVGGNIIKTHNSVVFIDWEYGGINDIAFDIASLFSENKVNQKGQDLFWTNYAINENDNIKERVDFWIDFQNLLWSVWHINKLANNDLEQDDYGLKRFLKLNHYWEV